jgi:choline dehydrogenase-like flavoprotein
MTAEFDAVIVGSGPGGVSAAFPLADRGLRIMLVDAGGSPSPALPKGAYLKLRAEDDEQWRWMVGCDFHALNGSASSPKFRAPTVQHVFADFLAENSLVAEGFQATGSLASGGLSNAWGAGVACFDSTDFGDPPFPMEELAASYQAVAERIGISGQAADDLSEYFGLDRWSQAPIPMDGNHQFLWQRYARRRAELRRLDFRLGRARVAVLSHAMADRLPCDLSGLCLWGCHRQSVYSAMQDVARLAARSNVTWQSNVVIEAFRRDGHSWLVRGHHRTTRTPFQVRTGRLLLAAGALASARLVLAALGWYGRPIPVLSNPVAAFALWIPARLAARREPAFGLAQLSFTAADVTPLGPAFGNLFSTQGVPVAEFARYAPASRRYGIDLLGALLPSMVAGNCFLPGALSRHRATLSDQGVLSIEGGLDPDVGEIFRATEQRLRRAFRSLGALLPPGAFVPAPPGADVHYSGTVPMQRRPGPTECDADGEVVGLPGVHVVDGSALPSLPAKAHTLTIMANADRIAKRLAQRIKPEVARTATVR